MKKSAWLFMLGLVAFVGLMESCKKDDDAPMVTKMSLYDSLGGSAMVNDPANAGMKIEQGRLGIRSVVDSAIFVIAGDAKINGFFTVLLAEVTTGNTSGFERLSKNLTDFICVATGGKSFTYGGLNMKDAHDPVKNPRMNGKASNADFDAFIADLVVAAKKNGLSDQLIGQVGALVETLRPVVVQKS
ncbi:group I truncated hemoglobin [Chitinophaga pinensis]|uniref:Group 1 truncated hemoglobin n=1 Tax=Chitinophaga pinensis TaxID=79329 RepID=A0A5C6LPA1_9BACT|nr:group 1 truncated hemoglobin [Chitinophaga pinensis]TWV94350.1 group 1 truncated hemoglobin [Chitinophaga pinensis]TWV97415.1 group 1 truncated hemoglobin [Chitinophaga pinensis]